MGRCIALKTEVTEMQEAVITGSRQPTEGALPPGPPASASFPPLRGQARLCRAPDTKAEASVEPTAGLTGGAGFHPP